MGKSGFTGANAGVMSRASGVHDSELGVSEGRALCPASLEVIVDWTPSGDRERGSAGPLSIPLLISMVADASRQKAVGASGG